MTKSEKCYLAGFFDGEGTVGIRVGSQLKNTLNGEGSEYYLRIRIVNTDEDILKWIKAITGEGYIYRRPFKNPKWKTAFEWAANGTKALKILKEIYPFLRVKRTQAEIAFKFEKTLAGRGGQGKKLTKESLGSRLVLRSLILKENNL